MSDTEFYTPGWVDRPDDVVAVQQELTYPYWGTTPAAQVDLSALPSEVFLWKAYEKLMKRPWPSRNQGRVGSCVSFGTAAAIEATIALEVAAGEPEEVRDLCQEVIYAGSRVEANGGRVPFRGDGSVGAWAAKFVKNWGILDRGTYGRYDLSKYDEARCRAWGDSGVPDDLEPEVRKFPVKTVTVVKSWEGFKQAISQGYGISICSNQGFSMSRSADGFASPRGSWAHCMAGLGYQTGKREGAWICNSWGPNAHSGPVGAGDPPPCGFWADADVVDRMLRQGDSWAFSAVQGFPSRRINWLI